MKREWREALLRGYWDSDGDRTENGMHATSASKRLLLGVKMLAAGLGAPSGLSMHEPTRARCVIEGRIVNEKTNYMLTAYDHPRKSIMTELGYWGHVREIGAGREKCASTTSPSRMTTATRSTGLPSGTVNQCLWRVCARACMRAPGRDCGAIRRIF